MRANEISFLFVPLGPAHKAGLAGHLPAKIRWQSKKLQIQGVQILRNEAYLQYAAVIYPVKYFLCLMLLFSSGFYTPYLLFDMTAFNLTGQGMQRNAALRLCSGL
jgi:hypothetical protein